MITKQMRRLAGTVIVCCGLAACSSAAGAGGASSPAAAARGFFTALIEHHPSTARDLACSSGWTGPRHFSFVTATDRPITGDADGILRQVHPVAHPASDGWTVRLGPSGIPALRVVRTNGRYLVCGYRSTG